MDPCPTAPETTGYALPLPRLDTEALKRLAPMAHNPVLDSLLGMVGGIVSVLTPSRQILMVNDGFLALIGAPDADRLFGLRPGEALACPQAATGPDGCGTSRLCPSCGMAVALVAAMASSSPAERTCALQCRPDAGARLDLAPLDLVLRVRAVPVRFDGQDLIVVLLEDITLPQQMASLERSFLHDLSNTVTSLSFASRRLAASGSPDPVLARTVDQLIRRLSTEVSCQRALSSRDLRDLDLEMKTVPPVSILDDLQAFTALHPVCARRRVAIPVVRALGDLLTDRAVLGRVLANMVLNACEATPENGEIRVAFAHAAEGPEFSVWNPAAIPDVYQPRIFQRNFSTKPGLGHGLGTFGMKLLGEKALGGRVSFTSSPAEGTTFRIRLPGR